MQKSAKNKLKKQANFNQNKQPCKSSKIHKSTKNQAQICVKTARLATLL